MSSITPTFGDNVCIRSTPLTRRLGYAGCTGRVEGETTPSVTGIEVIGDVKDDFALNVVFEDLDQDHWFAPELVEFVDHAPGSEVVIGDRHFIRDSSGNWHEQPGTKHPLKQRLVNWLLKSFRDRS